MPLGARDGCRAVCEACRRAGGRGTATGVSLIFASCVSERRENIATSNSSSRVGVHLLIAVGAQSSQIAGCSPCGV